MPPRIAFDLDGVLADLGSALKCLQRRLFPSALSANAVAAADPNVGSDAAKFDKSDAHEWTVETRHHGLTTDQQQRLWREVSSIENFWETLEEAEAGGVRSLAEAASKHRWEIIFLTRRPESAGMTSQVQSQRWLERHGFPLPSVFVVTGSRGKIADALDLDFVIDDTPANCIDVISDSHAKAILLWRDRSATVQAAARRLGIAVVNSIPDCLDVLASGANAAERPTMIDRVKWALGVARTR